MEDLRRVGEGAAGMGMVPDAANKVAALSGALWHNQGCSKGQRSMKGSQKLTLAGRLVLVGRQLLD